MIQIRKVDRWRTSGRPRRTKRRNYRRIVVKAQRDAQGILSIAKNGIGKIGDSIAVEIAGKRKSGIGGKTDLRRDRKDSWLSLRFRSGARET